MHLEHDKFIPELVDGLTGSLAGDLRHIEVTFPNKTRGPGSSMAGTVRALRMVCLMSVFSFRVMQSVVSFISCLDMFCTDLN